MDDLVMLWGLQKGETKPLWGSSARGPGARSQGRPAGFTARELINIITLAAVEDGLLCEIPFSHKACLRRALMCVYVCCPFPLKCVYACIHTCIHNVRNFNKPLPSRACLQVYNIHNLTRITNSRSRDIYAWLDFQALLDLAPPTAWIISRERLNCLREAIHWQTRQWSHLTQSISPGTKLCTPCESNSYRQSSMNYYFATSCPRERGVAAEVSTSDSLARTCRSLHLPSQKAKL
jgi:hypothetical protein